MAVYDQQTLRTSAEMAAVAELAYLDDDGGLRIEALTPLILDKEPAFALPYSRTDLAYRLEKSPEVSLSFSDSRIARVGWSPLAVEGRVEVVPDTGGDLFLEELLSWELRKFWPSRQLIGSLVLRRDNWWYVPRLILRFTETETPRPIARRTGPEPRHSCLEERGRRRSLRRRPGRRLGGRTSYGKPTLAGHRSARRRTGDPVLPRLLCSG